MPDQQDRAEATDDDKIGGEYPPEELLGADRPQDDAIPETLAQREARTNPEIGGAADHDTVRDGAEDEVAETPAPAEEAALRVTESG